MAADVGVEGVTEGPPPGVHRLGSIPGEPPTSRAEPLGRQLAGHAARGVALLTGLVVCGTCGHRMHATYPSKSAAYYSCEQHLKVGTGPSCHGLRTTPVDDLVARQVLRALEPAALELSLQAAQDVRQERDRLHRHWEQQLERARYESERAERQYHAVEPENRLVARTLERAGRRP